MTMTIAEIIKLNYENVNLSSAEEILAMCRKLYIAQVELDDYIEQAKEEEKDYLYEVANMLDNNLGYLLTH